MNYLIVVPAKHWWSYFTIDWWRTHWIIVNNILKVQNCQLRDHLYFIFAHKEQWQKKIAAQQEEIDRIKRHLGLRW